MALTTVKQGGIAADAVGAAAIATDAVGTDALDQDAGFTLAGLNSSSTVASEGGAVNISISEGLIKVRVHHSGDSPSINDSLNTASVTDNGVGDYSYNYTNNMNNVYYSTNAMSTEDGSIGYMGMYYDRSYTRLASTVRVQSINHLNNYDDGVYTSAMISGDLA